MNFGEFLKRDTNSKGVVAPAPVLSRLERELKAGKTLSVLLGNEATLDELPLEHLREIVDSFRRWERWRKRASAVGRQLDSVEREVISWTTRAHQLDLIERAAKLARQSSVEALSRPGVLATALELWDSCRLEARRRGQLIVRLAREDHPLAADYGDYVRRKEDIDTLKSHRWLAMRRGEREGVLEIELDCSAAPLEMQVVSRRERFGLVTRHRTDTSLLQELVLDDLRNALWDDLDEWARAESLQFACDAYSGLLQARPLKVERLASVFLGAPHAPVGAAILDGAGALLDHFEADPHEKGWMTEVIRFLTINNVNHLVVPSDTRSSKRLSTIEEQIGQGVSVTPVRPAAMREGRAALERQLQSLPKTVASAVTLARRALDPMKAWSSIDPVRAGVGEYQAEIDEEELREALMTSRALIQRSGRKTAAAPQAVIPKTKPLGPLVRTVAELRPGMTLSGQVTNITGFGAFVALGLEYEGMVHVSELSDEFISNPNEVVKIGDKVTARVLAVDPKRRRISLSLRQEQSRDRRVPRRSGGPQRHQALRDLEKLFKS